MAHSSLSYSMTPIIWCLHPVLVFNLVFNAGKKVGRAKELLEPDEVIEQVDSRTIAASPLPYNVKLEDVESFFAQCGKVNSVRLPRHVSDKRHFCGTALVEFSEEDEAKGVYEKTLVLQGQIWK